MSTGEEREPSGRLTNGGLDPEVWPPFHAGLPPSSHVEVLEDGISRYDPETAHKAAGDASYQRRIPDSCGLCQATALAEAAAAKAKELGQKEDAEWLARE